MNSRHFTPGPSSRRGRPRRSSNPETSPAILDWLESQLSSLPASRSPPPPSRKRKRERESSVGNDPATQDHKRRRRASSSKILLRPSLTPETLRLFDGCETSGQTPSTMDAPSLLSASSDSAEAISPYHARFADELRARGVCFADFDEGNSPKNFDELKTALFRDRDSPEPDEGAVNVFRRLVEKVGNETGVTQHLLPKVLPVIEQTLLSNDDATVANQQWDRKVLLEPDRRPSLSVPKPDQTFGWGPEVFPFDKAKKALKHAVRPVAQFPSLHWPFFIAEVKGELGARRIARLQNLSSAAILLNNMLQLKMAVGDVDNFLDRVQILSLEFTTETIQISCYWALRGEGDSFRYFGKTAACSTPNDPSGEGFIRGRKHTLNALGWIRGHTRTWIYNDMQTFEGKLQEASSQLTPPQSQSDLSNAQKRRRASAVQSKRSRSKSAHSSQRDAAG